MKKMKNFEIEARAIKQLRAMNCAFIVNVEKEQRATPTYQACNNYQDMFESITYNLSSDSYTFDVIGDVIEIKMLDSDVELIQEFKPISKKTFEIQSLILDNKDITRKEFLEIEAIKTRNLKQEIENTLFTCDCTTIDIEAVTCNGITYNVDAFLDYASTFNYVPKKGEQSIIDFELVGCDFKIIRTFDNNEIECFEVIEIITDSLKSILKLKNTLKTHSLILASDMRMTFDYCVDFDALIQVISSVYSSTLESVDFVDNNLILSNDKELEFMLIGSIGQEILFDISDENIENLSDENLNGIFRSEHKEIYQD